PCLPKQLELEEFAERAPSLHATGLGGLLAGEPPQLGGPVRRVQVAAGACVNRFVVERRAKHLGLGEASSVGPHIYGRDRMPARIDTEKPMPECRHTDRAGFLGRTGGMNRVRGG